MNKILYQILIAIIFTTSLCAQVHGDSKNYIALNFNEPIIKSGLITKSNYTFKDSSSGQTLELVAVGINKSSEVYVTSSGDSSFTQSIIVTPKLEWGRTYYIEVNNVKDTAGNVIDPVKKSIYYNLDDAPDRPSKPDITMHWKPKEIQIPIIDAWAKDTSQTTTLPWRAYDGVTYTGDVNQIWTSNPLPEWIVFKLDMARDVYRIEMSPSYFHNGRVYSYSIEYSMGGTYWYTFTPLTYSVANQEWMKYNVHFSCDRIRIRFITNNQSNYAGLYEFRVFGE